MGETIESFVAKLQAEGVQAGQEEAKKLRAEASQQAEQIAQQAKQQAEKIVADARQEAEKLLSRSQSELRLAARDTVHRLREALERALREVLAHGAEQKLSDPDFLGNLLHELIILYAQADIEQKNRITIDLRPDLRDKLLAWALQETAQKAEAAGLRMDLKGTLKEAGFEYGVSGAKVEVTLSSVAETLSEMVGPKLREVIAQAVADEGPGAEGPQQPQGQKQ